MCAAPLCHAAVPVYVSPGPARSGKLEAASRRHPNVYMTPTKGCRLPCPSGPTRADQARPRQCGQSVYHGPRCSARSGEEPRLLLTTTIPPLISPSEPPINLRRLDDPSGLSAIT